MQRNHRKFVALLLSGGVLLAIGSCGQLVIDALYLLPDIISAVDSVSTT